MGEGGRSTPRISGAGFWGHLGGAVDPRKDLSINQKGPIRTSCKMTRLENRLSVSFSKGLLPSEARLLGGITATFLLPRAQLPSSGAQQLLLPPPESQEEGAVEPGASLLPGSVQKTAIGRLPCAGIPLCRGDGAGLRRNQATWVTW